MVRLNSPNRKIFSQKDFEEYPVWTWDDEMEGHLPIADKYPSWDEYGTYFIRSSFQKDNHMFDGYLVGNRSFYAFGLFVSSRLIGFNLNLSNWIKKSEKEILRLLKCESFELFPLHYTSPVQFKDWPEISGVFMSP